MTTAAFHLCNREAMLELNVYLYYATKSLPFCPVPTFLGVKPEKTFTDRPHLEAPREKLFSRISLLSKFARSGWSANAKHFAQLSYLWLTQPSTAYQFVIAALMFASSTKWKMKPSALSLDACFLLLPSAILSGIPPAELLQGATLSTVNHGCLDTNRILLGRHNKRLKCRRPFVASAWK